MKALGDIAHAHGFSTWHEVADEAQLCALLTSNAGSKHFAVIGNGSQLGCGAPIRRDAELLSLRRLDQIIELDPEDLSITVQPGISLGKVQTAIQEHGLMLDSGPFPGQEQRSIAGLLAEAPPSPRGHDRGSLRSQVLGLRGVDGKGRVFRAGGRVIKNVAGYDMMRLFVGSGGSMFAGLEFTLRLVHQPEAELCLHSREMSQGEGIAAWLHLRRSERELRACDLILLPGGKSKVCAFFEGPTPFIDALRDDLAKPQWQQFSPQQQSLSHVPTSGSPMRSRGALRASQLGSFLQLLKQDMELCLHMQGDFILYGAWDDSTHWPEACHLRAIEPQDGSSELPIGTRISRAEAQTAEQLQHALGDSFACGRYSFDTGPQHVEEEA